MDLDESSHESGDEAYIDRRSILDPAIRAVVNALGGYESGSYRLGDEAYGCLKDLKKFWRKDDTDDERTVARIFWETRVLPNDLVPILLSTAGKGDVEDKRAIACADLMAAMTWPIDMAEELKELDEEFDKGTDYTQLLSSHLNYKAALLKPGVMEALFGIMIPCLAKEKKERVERDVQIINVVLYLIRNLAFIKDPPPNMHLSSDQAEFSSLQSKLIKTLSQSNITDLLLTIASNAKEPLYNGWNTMVLEIFYLLFRGVTPLTLSMDQVKQPAAQLHRLLEVEQRRRRDVARTSSSRHSRFGTTISIKLNPKKAAKAREDVVSDSESVSASQTYVMHRQQAISGEAGNIMDLAKRQKTQKGKRIDDLGRDDNLSIEARSILQHLARSFVELCFNPFLSSLLKDIKSERAKITEKDNLRLLFLTKWFLEFFLRVRLKQNSDDKDAWNFGLVAEVTERGWIVWVLKRMREAVEDKPKLWTELQAGIECLTQLLALIDNMTNGSSPDPAVVEAAEVLQQQLIYSGEVLDIAFESLRSYREGTQSLAYLESSVRLAHGLFKMLEKWAKAKGEMYVKKRVKARKKRAQGKSTEEGEGVPDVEDEEPVSADEDVIRETMFTLETFEAKFAHSEISHTLLTYLGRYKEFTSPEDMKPVVSLLHRQAVKAKAEGLFFQASTLDLFKSILADQKSLPREKSFKELISLINFILRQFFKAVAEDPLLVVEAFFPKTRGTWKQYSSWQPEEKVKKDKSMVEDTRFPQDVQVKKGYSWSEQLGIAIACLTEDGKEGLVTWVKEILSLAIGQRERIIEETDGDAFKGSGLGDDDDSTLGLDDSGDRIQKGPSEEALDKITDYLIPYINDEQADGATKNPHLKLVFRLLKFDIIDEDANELEWYIPKAILPADLQSSYNVINQFLENPIDLDGKKASTLLSKKPRRRRRRRQATPASDVDSDILDDVPKKKEKKKKEDKQYKSAQFIEDSDAEEGDLEAFFEKEEKLRERMALAAVDGVPKTMRSTGTKKRRKKATDKAAQRKRRKSGTNQPIGGAQSLDDGNSSHSEDSDLDIFGSPRGSITTDHTSPPLDAESPRPKSRPKPKPRFRGRRSSADPLPSNELAGGEPSGSREEDRDIQMSSDHDQDLDAKTGSVESEAPPSHTQGPPRGTKKKGRLVLSDDDE